MICFAAASSGGHHRGNDMLFRSKVQEDFSEDFFEDFSIKQTSTLQKVFCTETPLYCLSERMSVFFVIKELTLFSFVERRSPR